MNNFNNLERLFTILYHKYDLDLAYSITPYIDQILHNYISNCNFMKNYIRSEIEYYEE